MVINKEPDRFSFEFPKILPLLTPAEIYALADQDLLQRLKEDRRIERKPPGLQPKFCGEYFSMWANTAPEGGILVVGIENNGAIKGCSGIPHGRLNDLEAAGRVYCPDARHVSRRVSVTNEQGVNDFLLVFYVHYTSDKVVKTVSGEAFIRIAESKHRLNSEEIRYLEVEKGQVDFEQETTDLKYPDAFDAELIRQFTDSVKKSGNLTGEHPQSEILLQRRLGTKTARGFKPNVACVLLFAKDPLLAFPGCKVRFLRFEGEHEGTGEKFNAVKDVTIEGPVPILIKETESVLESQLRTFSKLGKDGKFYTAPEYPKPAWYEAIVNACVHRSYTLKNMNIFVKMFDDRLVVESPGGFPPFVSAENIYENSHPRNPHLMNAMFHLDFVKAANEGTRRMRDTMVQMNLPKPEFSEKETGNTQVRVILRNNVKQRRMWIDSDVSAVFGASILKDLSEHQRMAINWAAEHGSINVSQLQRLTGRSWHSAKVILQKMTAKGVLHWHRREKLDRDPEAKYTIKKLGGGE